jgi:hypothetical protein
MDAVERMLIERECQRLVTLYCHYVDHGHAERIADLFTDDGVWRSAEVTMAGREQLRRGFEQRQANRRRASCHVCTSLLVEVTDADHAEGCAYLTLYRHDGEEGRTFSPLDGGPVVVGEYRDRFVRTQDGWRFAVREIEVSFRRPVE